MRHGYRASWTVKNESRRIGKRCKLVGQQMKTFLDNFAAILGAVTVGLLLLSVTHEYGCFWVVGSRFQTFLTTTDYFSNAILWLPWLFVISYGYVDWDVLFGKRKYGFGRNWKTALWFLFIFGTPIAALFFADEFWIFSFIIPGILLWVMVSGKLPYANSEIPIQQLAYRATLIVPIVAAIAFGYGVTQGQSALKSFDEPYQLELKGGDKIHRILLRTFDKGLLVRDSTENRIDFIKWEELHRLSRFAPPERKMPVSCAMFRINCPQPVTVP